MLRRQQNKSAADVGRRQSVMAELSHHDKQQISGAFEAIHVATQEASVLLVQGHERVIRDVKTLLRARIQMEESGHSMNEVDCSDFVRDQLKADGIIVLNDAVAEHLTTQMGLPKPVKGYRYQAGDMLRGNYRFGGITRVGACG